MQERQRNAPSCGTKYQGEDYRLYVTAKAITFLSLLALGIPAWDCAKLDRPQAFFEFFPKTRTQEALKFLGSCLIACLDCLSEVNGNKEIMSSICNNIATINLYASRILVASPRNPRLECMVPAVEELGEASVPMFLRVFRKCFERIVSDSNCGEESDICLRSLLTALRGALFLSGNVESRRWNTMDSIERRQYLPQTDTQYSPPPGFNDDDPFGGIDDSVLASLDIDGAQQAGDNMIAATFSFLCEALKQAMVR
jgi:hypothetical protein